MGSEHDAAVGRATAVRVNRRVCPVIERRHVLGDIHAVCCLRLVKDAVDDTVVLGVHPGHWPHQLLSHTPATRVIGHDRLAEIVIRLSPLCSRAGLATIASLRER